jgi:protein-tyrosine phosphatase
MRTVLAAARAGKVIAIHCHAGIGRTGLFAACLAKAIFGLNGGAAVDWVRQAVPAAVESQAQYRFIEQFEFDPEQA